jgi:hypothetical protein
MTRTYTSPHTGRTFRLPGQVRSRFIRSRTGRLYYVSAPTGRVIRIDPRPRLIRTATGRYFWFDPLGSRA